MKKETRKYQQEAEDAIINEWKSGHNKTLLVLPTGTGKTVVFTDILKRVLTSGKKALVLAHTGELLNQAMDKIERFGGLATSLEKASDTAVDSDSPVVVGSIQTLCREERLNKFPRDYFEYIIVDEAHHCLSASYQKVLKYFNDAKVLGVTATPNRGDHKELATYFDSKAYEYEFKTAISDGYLCPIKTHTIPLEIDITAVKMQNGDFAAGDIGNSLDAYLEMIAKEIKIRCVDRKTVVFLPLVSTSQKFCQMLNDIGVSAAEINGKSTDRDDILERFNNGEYKVLCNAMLLTEGWDCPDVDCIVVLRPTRSDALYRQMVGRGCRIASGKDNLLLLDFLWLSRKIDLMHPANLVGENDDIISRMTKKAAASDEDFDLSELEGEAVRDYEAEIEAKLKKELERAAKRKSIQNKCDKAKSILLKVGKIFHTTEFVLYEHCYKWEFEPITDAQKNGLIKFGLLPRDAEHLTKGAACTLMTYLIQRRKYDRCTFKQARILDRYGINPAYMSFADASDEIDKLFRKQELR